MLDASSVLPCTPALFEPSSSCAPNTWRSSLEIVSSLHLSWKTCGSILCECRCSFETEIQVLLLQCSCGSFVVWIWASNFFAFMVPNNCLVSAVSLLFFESVPSTQCCGCRLQFHLFRHRKLDLHYWLDACSSSNGQTATLEEFQKVLCSMKLQGLVPLAPRIFKLFDYNHDGWVDLREVICGFTALLRSAHEEGIRLCFKVNPQLWWWLHCIGFTVWPLFNLLVGTKDITTILTALFIHSCFLWFSRRSETSETLEGVRTWFHVVEWLEIIKMKLWHPYKLVNSTF